MAGPPRPLPNLAGSVPVLAPAGKHAGKPGFKLERPVIEVGSRKHCRLHLLSESVSKIHALIVRTSTGVYIRDLASRTHVYVNNVLVHESDLQSGDLVNIGSFSFKFLAGRETPTAATRVLPMQAAVEGFDSPVPFNGRVLLIGHRDGCDLHLPDPSVSTCHAVIFQLDDAFYIRDLASRTGTFVNGEAIHQVAITPSDVIHIGTATLRLEPVSAPVAQPQPSSFEARVAPLHEDSELTPSLDAPVQAAEAPAAPTRIDDLPAAVAPPPIQLDDDIAISSAAIGLLPDDVSLPTHTPAVAQNVSSPTGTPDMPASPEDTHEDLIHLDIEPDLPPPSASDTVHLPASGHLPTPPVSATQRQSAEDASKPRVLLDADMKLGTLSSSGTANALQVDTAIAKSRSAARPSPEVGGETAPATGPLRAIQSIPPFNRASITPADPSDEADLLDEPLVVPELNIRTGWRSTRSIETPPDVADLTDILLDDAPDERLQVAEEPVEASPLEEDRAESPTIEADAPTVPNTDAIQLAEEPEPAAQEPPAPAYEPAPPVEESTVLTEEPAALVDEPSVTEESTFPAPESSELADEASPRADAESFIRALSPVSNATFNVEALPALDLSSPDEESEPPVPPAANSVTVALDESVTEDVTADPRLAHLPVSDAPAAPVPADVQATDDATPEPSPVVFDAHDDVDLEEIELSFDDEPSAPISDVSDHDDSAAPVVHLDTIDLTHLGSDDFHDEPDQSADMLDLADETGSPVVPLFTSVPDIGIQTQNVASAVHTLDEIDLTPIAELDEPLPAEPAAPIVATTPEPVLPTVSDAPDEQTETLPLQATLNIDEVPSEDKLKDNVSAQDSLTYEAPTPAESTQDLSTQDALTTATTIFPLHVDDLVVPAHETTTVGSEPDPAPRRRVKVKRESRRRLPAAEVVPERAEEVAPSGISDTTLPRTEDLASPPIEPDVSIASPLDTAPATPILATVSDSPITSSDFASTDLAPAADQVPDEIVASTNVAAVSDADASKDAVTLGGTSLTNAEVSAHSADVEVLAPADASPESALEVGDAFDLVDLLDPVEEIASNLSDSSLGRSLEQLAGDNAQDLVEVSASTSATHSPEVAAAPLTEVLADNARADNTLGDDIPADDILADDARSDDAPISPAVAFVLRGPEVAVPISQPADPGSDDAASDLLQPPDDLAMDPAELGRSIQTLASGQINHLGGLPLKLEEPEFGQAAVSFDEASHSPLPPIDDAPLVTSAQEIAMRKLLGGDTPLLAPKRIDPIITAKGDVVAIGIEDDTQPQGYAHLAPEAATNSAQDVTQLDLSETDINASPFATTSKALVDAHATFHDRAADPVQTESDDSIDPKMDASSIDEVPIDEAPADETLIDEAHVDDASLDIDADAPELDLTDADVSPDVSTSTLPDRPGEADPLQSADLFEDEPTDAEPGDAVAPPPLPGVSLAGGALAGGLNLPKSLSENIPPFDARAARGRGKSMDGILSGGRQADVFAEHSKPAPADPFGARNPELPPSQFQIPDALRGRSPRNLNGDADTGDDERSNGRQRARGGAAVWPTREAVETLPRQARKRVRRRSIPVLLAMMLIVMAGGGAAIWFLVPPRVKVEAAFLYKNLNAPAVSETYRRQYRARQETVLRRDDTRELAKRLLPQGIVPGFLGDTVSLSRVTNTALTWPDSRGDTLLVSIEGADTFADTKRVSALLQALYQINAAEISGVQDLAKQVQLSETSVREAQGNVDQLRLDLAGLNVAAQARPTVEQLAELREKVSRAEATWTTTREKIQDLQAAIKRLSLTDNPDENPAQVQAEKADPQIAQMRLDLAELTAKMDAARSSSTGEAEAARKALDASIASVQQQIEALQEGIKDSPELTAFVTAAKALQETTRQLTAEFIRNQQVQYSRLNDYKQKLEEQLVNRREEIFTNDPQLKELSEKYDLAIRRYNAAKETGLDADAEDVKAEMESLDTLIRARKTLLGDDRFYKNALADTQRIIDATQGDMQKNRERFDQILEDLQAQFQGSAPAVEKLPEAQKALASALKKRLDEMTAARKQYADAAEATNPQANEQIKALQEASSALAAKLKAREEQLAELAVRTESERQRLTREQQLEARQKELVDARADDKIANAAVFAADRELRSAEASLEEARTASERVEALKAQRESAQKELTLRQNTLKMHQTQLAQAIEPAGMPTEPNATKDDPRFAYILFLLIPLFLVFSGLILMNLRTLPIAHPIEGYDRDDVAGRTRAPDSDDSEAALT